MATQPKRLTPDQRSYIDLTLTTEADGLSDVGDLNGLACIGVEMSTGWTSADLAFYGSPLSSDNMYPVYRHISSSTGPVNLMQINTTASRIVGLEGRVFHGLRFLQLASINVASTAALAQAAERTVRLLLAPPAGPIK